MAKKLSKGGHKRRGERFPGLKREMHPRTRWEYLDQDYIDQLSDEEKAFLSKFNDEFYGASLAPKDDKVALKKDLHRTKKLRKDCRDRNNARNRDTYTIHRTRGMVTNIHDKFGNIVESIDINHLNPGMHENVMVELVDMKKSVDESALNNSKRTARNKSKKNS